MPESIVSFFETYGYWVVFIGAVADNTGIPSAGDIVLLVGGALAAQGQLKLHLVIFFGALGALIGDNVVYQVGRHGGGALVRGERRLIKIPHKVLDKGEHFFDKHGWKGVFLGRFAPGMRSMTPFLAGLHRMHFLTFFITNLLAVIAWATLIGLLANFFGSNWETLMLIMRRLRIAAVIIVVALVGTGVYLYLRRRKRRRERAAAVDTAIDAPEGETALAESGADDEGVDAHGGDSDIAGNADGGHHEEGESERDESGSARSRSR